MIQFDFQKKYIRTLKIYYFNILFQLKYVSLKLHLQRWLTQNQYFYSNSFYIRYTNQISKIKQIDVMNWYDVILTYILRNLKLFSKYI